MEIFIVAVHETLSAVALAVLLRSSRAKEIDGVSYLSEGAPLRSLPWGRGVIEDC